VRVIEDPEGSAVAVLPGNVITTVLGVKGTLSVAALFAPNVTAPPSVILLPRAANDPKATFKSVEVCMLKPVLVEAVGPPTVTAPATSVSVWAVAATAAPATVQITVSVASVVALVNAQVQVALLVVKVPTLELSTAVK
jgi:hypothetical protein